MSSADADPVRPARPSTPGADLVIVLVVVGLAGIVTAGGIAVLAARIRTSVTGFEVDGLSLLLPGLVVTAVVTLVTGATIGRIARGARRVTADALARHASSRALLPLAVTAVLVVVLAEHAVPGGLAEVAMRRPGAVVVPVLLFAVAAGALVVAARARGRRTRIRALGIAGTALVGAACAEPHLVTASLQSGALVVCAALLLRRAPADADPVS
jgi:hypothetical protein